MEYFATKSLTTTLLFTNQTNEGKYLSYPQGEHTVYDGKD